MPKPPPPDWPRLSAAVFYEDPVAAIDWLERAFGFETRIRVDGAEGEVVHSELTYGGAVVMVAGLRREGVVRPDAASPGQIGGRNTQRLFLYVDDADAHCERARAAGGNVIQEPETVDYGEDHWSDRGYEIVDPEGHHWHFAHRVRSAT